MDGLFGILAFLICILQWQGRSKWGGGGLVKPPSFWSSILFTFYKRIHVDVIVRAVTQIEHILVLQAARIVCHNSSRHAVFGRLI